MNSQTLNAVALDVVGQYGVASKLLVEAYRVGAQRAVTKLAEGYTTAVQSPSLPMVDDSIRTSLVDAHQQLAGFFVGGVARATEQAYAAIDRMTDNTTQNLKRLSGFGERFESVIGASAVDALTKVHMPAARMSLQIAGQVVEGSKRLVETVAGEDVVEAAVAEAVAAGAEPKVRARRAA